MLTCYLRFHLNRVTIALRIVTSYYEHFTCSYEYFNNRYVYFTNDDTLRFVGFICVLGTNPEDS